MVKGAFLLFFNILAYYSVFVSQSVWMEIGIQLDEQKLPFRITLLLVK